MRVIDYFECSGWSLHDLASLVRRKPYRYSRHFFPHDSEVHEYTTGRTRIATARELLGAIVRVVPRSAISDGIHAVREIFASCWIDAVHCARGLEHLGAYAREYDERTGIFLDRPRHDAHSHAADAFRYLALSLRLHDNTRARAFEYDGLG